MRAVSYRTRPRVRGRRGPARPGATPGRRRDPGTPRRPPAAPPRPRPPPRRSPGEPQGGHDPHPAGRTPETALGRGVAGETIAADATSDVTHDFPVLGPRLGPASRHPAGSSGRAARRT